MTRRRTAEEVLLRRLERMGRRGFRVVPSAEAPFITHQRQPVAGQERNQ